MKKHIGSVFFCLGDRVELISVEGDKSTVCACENPDYIYTVDTKNLKVGVK
jgi:hypothetical protein